MIISTWNSAKYIQECIESIFSLGIPDIEIVVVDSGSRDGTSQYLQSLGDRIRFLPSEKKLTWSEANQIGLNVCRGDWICLSNPDIHFNGSFREMFDLISSRKDIVAAAPQLILPDGRLQRPAKTITPFLSLCAHTRILRLLFKKAASSHLFPYDPDGGEVCVDSPQGSLFLVHRSVLERLGGHLWGEGYLNGVSDFDAFLNMKRIGIAIHFFPQHRIVHYGSYITKRYPIWVERDQARGLVLYFRRWQKMKSPKRDDWMSPLLYSILFGLEGIAATLLEVAGRVLKGNRPFFTPRWDAWQAGQRILGLIDGWRIKL